MMTLNEAIERAEAIARAEQINVAVFRMPDGDHVVSRDDEEEPDGVCVAEAWRE